MTDVATRLRDEAERLSGSSITNGCPGCGIAANVAEEVADYLDRLSAPDVGVGLTRYGLVPLDDASDRMQPCGNGEWVRHEDVAPLLAAARAVPADVKLTRQDIIDYTAPHVPVIELLAVDESVA